MTGKHFIDLVDEWIKENNFFGANCERTTIQDNILNCILEHQDFSWVRTVQFNIPELLSEYTDNDARNFIDKQMITQVHKWGNDNEDAYKYITFLCGGNENDVKVVKKTIIQANNFFEAQKELKYYSR